MIHNSLITALLLAICITSTVALANPQAIEVPAATPQMQTYSTIRYALYFIGTVYSVVVYWLILQTGLSVKIRDLVASRINKRFFTCFYTILVLCVTVATLPFSFYAGFWLDRSFGLSDQSLLQWLSEVGKHKLVSIAIGAPVASLAFWIVNRFKNRGLVLWSVLTPLIAFMLFVYPVVVDPLFNKVTPLKQPKILTEIQDIQQKAGIPGAPVFVVDKSRQTNKVNAYVTGLAGTTRIVICDNTLKKLPDEGVLAIVAHEIGHYVLGHIVQGFELVAGGLFVGLLLLQCFEAKLLAALPKRWGIKGKDDPAIIPAVLLGSILTLRWNLTVRLPATRMYG